MGGEGGEEGGGEEACQLSEHSQSGADPHSPAGWLAGVRGSLEGVCLMVYEVGGLT